MTVCNMSIEAGAKAGLIAPDDTTFAYLEGPAARAAGRRVGRRRRRVAVARHRRRGRRSTRRSQLDAADIVPHVSWGTNPGQVAPITERVPDPGLVRRSRGDASRPNGRWSTWASPPAPRCATSASTPCSSDRARTAASRIFVLRRGWSSRGQRVASGRAHARRAGFVGGQAPGGSRGTRHDVFIAAGFDWREPGCSMCLAMNPDKLVTWRALRVDVEPQLRGPSGTGRAHAPRLPRRGRRHRHRRPLRHPRGPHRSNLGSLVGS